MKLKQIAAGIIFAVGIVLATNVPVLAEQICVGTDPDTYPYARVCTPDIFDPNTFVWAVYCRVNGC